MDSFQLSKSRIVTPVRGLFCKHVECFDLRTFLEYHTNDAYWECPFTFCRTKLNCDQLRFDEFFSSILQNTRSTIVEAEIRPDGTWMSVKPSVVGAIVIKEEEPDEPQAPQASAPASAYIAVKEEPLEDPSADRTNDTPNLDAAKPKSLVTRRLASATFKAAQSVKRNAIRRQWKRGAVMKAGRKHQSISKGGSKTPMKVPPVQPIGKGQRCEKPEMLASTAKREDHASAEQSAVMFQQTSQPKPLSEATQPSTGAAGPSLSKDTDESMTSDLCKICGASFPDRSLFDHVITDHWDKVYAARQRGTTADNEQDLRALFENWPAYSRTFESTPTTLLAAKDQESRPAGVPSSPKNYPATWMNCRCGITRAEWNQGLHDGLHCDVMKRLLEHYRTLGYQPPKAGRATAKKSSGSDPSLRRDVGSRGTSKAPPPP
ncbi:MIZ/SPRING zinc finger domain containing protein [Aphelenchoides avenae]|nr:MIZ/SPRING zinc finger domain containing protein [Aphelenchus avenae]